MYADDLGELHLFLLMLVYLGLTHRVTKRIACVRELFGLGQGVPYKVFFAEMLLQAYFISVSFTLLGCLLILYQKNPAK